MTAPNRYCLAVCYCSHCPHYEPLPPLRVIVTKADKRRARVMAEVEDEALEVDLRKLGEGDS